MSEPNRENTAAAWEAAARAAARQALEAHGATVAVVQRRDASFDGVERWMSFEVADSDEVIWVAQIERSAPAGTAVVDTPLGEMGVWRYPNDPVLPGLRDAVAPDGLHRVLGTMLRSRGIDTNAVVVVALRPLQRAVIRIGDPGRCVYVKVVPPAIVDEIAEIHQRVHSAGVHAPEVLDVDIELGLIVFTEIAGLPLAERLERGDVLPDPAAVWAMIEQLGAVPLGRRSPARPFIGSPDPECPPVQTTIHGDLHDRQLIVDDHGALTGIVDLDAAGTGDLLDDLARLVAHISMRAELHPPGRSRIADAALGLLHEFARHVDERCLEQRIDVASDRLRHRARLVGGAGA